MRYLKDTGEDILVTPDNFLDVETIKIKEDFASCVSTDCGCWVRIFPTLSEALRFVELILKNLMIEIRDSGVLDSGSMPSSPDGV